MLSKTTIRFVLISALLFASLFSARAQTEVDSLKALLPELAGVERIQVMNVIADRLRAIDPDECLQINDQVLEEASREGYHKELVKAMMVRATLFINLNKVDDAEVLLSEAGEVAMKVDDYSIMANLQLTLGNLHARRENHSLAIEAMLEGLKIVEAENDQ